MSEFNNNMLSLAAKAVICKAGGPTKLAASLINPRTGKPITRNAVCMWQRVPVYHVLSCEALTGIPRYTQRPDIYGVKPNDSAV